MHEAHEIILRNGYKKLNVEKKFEDVGVEAGLLSDQLLEYIEWLKRSESKGLSPKKFGIVGPVEYGGLVGEFLAAGDLVGPLLGVITGCCQHPHGVAYESALHGHVNSNGRFFVFRHNGEIVLQSHVWKEGSTVVFDSLEGKVSRFGSAARKIVERVARRLIEEKQCAYVHGGAGYVGHFQKAKAVICKGDIYTCDSEVQCRIA